jgi:glycosyltransferase involved in cell wall biosynthesis
MEEFKKELIIFIPSIEDGGVEKNLYLILDYLSSRIKKIKLITFDNKKSNYFNSSIKIINPFFNFSFIKGRYPKYFFCILSLLKIIILNKQHVVLSFQANVFVIILSKIFNIKVLSRSNSSSAGWSKNPIKHFIFSYYFKKTDEIIVNSLEFKKEMDKKYKIKTKCILNPFNFDEILKKSKKKIKKIYTKKSIKLISVGRLTGQKDFLTLFEAVNLLKHKNVELIIIGKGQDKNILNEYIQTNNLENNIKLIGYKKNPFPYIKQADIFILSSIFEGSPNVLVEALFLKKHIISTNCPTGPNEILKNGKYGDLVKLKDYKGIAKNILKFASNNSKKNNLPLNLNRYSYKNNCEKYFQLIKVYL